MEDLNVSNVGGSYVRLGLYTVLCALCKVKEHEL